MNQPNEDQDPVWTLLKQARPTQIPTRFAQDAVREVRLLEGGKDRAWSGLGFLRAGGALAAAAAVVIGGFFLLKGADPQSGSAAEQTVQIVQIAGSDASSPDQEEISIEEFEAELDELVYMSELMGVSDTSLLPDEDLAALLF